MDMTTKIDGNLKQKKHGQNVIQGYQGSPRYDG